MKPTVVILLSDKRSGSTIFQKEIGRHPDVHQVSYSPHRHLETQHWLKAASLLESPAALYHGHKVYGAFKNRANARALLIDELRHNVPDFDWDCSDAELVFGGWEALCQSRANPVFFEKSPQHLAHWASLSLLLEWIKSTAMDVRVIGLVRNPMAVLYSAQQLFRSSPQTRQFGWADIYRNLLAFEQLLEPHQFHLLHYEELVQSPDETLNEVYRFIGLHPHSTGGDVHTGSTQRWIADSSFTLDLHESVKQVGRHFGYTDEDMFNPAKQGLSPGHRAARQVVDAWRSSRHRLVERVIKPGLLRLRQRGSKDVD